MTKIEGSWSNEFVSVKEALAKNLDDGEDSGASAAVFIDREPALDRTSLTKPGTSSPVFAIG